MNDKAAHCQAEPPDWWAARRLRYNGILLGAAPVSLACLFAIWWAFEDRLPCLQARGFSLMFGAILFVLGLGAANLFYCLGPLIERLLDPRHLRVYRPGAFALGTGFSLTLIFLPVLGNLMVVVIGTLAPGTCG